MRLFKLVSIACVIGWLISLGGPVIQADAAKLFSSATADAGHAISTIAQSGGLKDTWDSLVHLISDTAKEATK